MLADREVALRLAIDRNVDRKLRTATGSRFFWVYALSLWDPDAFWKCISGASGFALAGLLLAGVMPGMHLPSQFTATVIFEYFLIGLILMWVYNLGPWLHPSNLTVIFTFIFRLYRKNMTLGDLSAQEIGRMFPADEPPSGAGWRSVPSRLYFWMRRSDVLGSLALGLFLGAVIIAPRVLAV